MFAYYIYSSQRQRGSGWNDEVFCIEKKAIMRMQQEASYVTPRDL